MIWSLEKVLQISLKSLDQADLGTDGGNRVDAGGNPKAVPVAQLLPFSPVKGDPGGVSAVRRHRDLQFNACWHNYRPAELVWYDEW